MRDKTKADQSALRPSIEHVEHLKRSVCNLHCLKHSFSFFLQIRKRTVTMMMNSIVNMNPKIIQTNTPFSPVREAKSIRNNGSSTDTIIRCKE